MEILFIIIGVAVGLAIGYLFANNRSSQLQAKLEMLERSNAKQQTEYEHRLVEEKAESERRFAEEKA